jgi:hypothetical protein
VRTNQLRHPVSIATHPLSDTHITTSLWMLQMLSIYSRVINVTDGKCIVTVLLSPQLTSLIVSEVFRVSPTILKYDFFTYTPISMDISHWSLSLSVMLRPTVSRPVCLGIKHRFGAYDQLFFFLLSDSCRFVMWGALSDERTGLSFRIAAGPRQRSHSRVRLSQIQDFPFRCLLRLAGLRWRYWTVPPHGILR